ncbi:MAG: acetate--CoA ligase family protein [Desulfobacterales bacterium]|nr:acetate--CoA ligase family protein [Desulfobacterales bacterium]
MVCNLMTDKQQWSEVVRILREGGVPCYPLPGEAARAMAALVQYHLLRSRETAAVQPFSDVKPDKARKIMDKARSAGRNSLAAAEVYGILEAYKIPVAKWKLAATPAEAAEAAAKIGFPVVVKAEAASVVHKSDMGGVALESRERQRRQERGRADAKSHHRAGPALLRPEIPAGRTRTHHGRQGRRGPRPCGGVRPGRDLRRSHAGRGLQPHADQLRGGARDARRHQGRPAAAGRARPERGGPGPAHGDPPAAFPAAHGPSRNPGNGPQPGQGLRGQSVRGGRKRYSLKLKLDAEAWKKRAGPCSARELSALASILLAFELPA